jgi:hypothetical protein
MLQRLGAQLLGWEDSRRGGGADAGVIGVCGTAELRRDSEAKRVCAAEGKRSGGAGGPRWRLGLGFKGGSGLLFEGQRRYLGVRARSRGGRRRSRAVAPGEEGCDTLAVKLYHNMYEM